MIAAIIVFALLLISWSVALTLLLRWYWRAADAYEEAAGHVLEHVHLWTKVVQGHLLKHIAEIPALAFDASPEAVGLREALLEQPLRYLTATLLVVERRLSNRMTLLTELLSPFYVSLTKQQIPEKFVPQYLQVDEPQFDEGGAIAAAETKVRESLLGAGKLIDGSSEDPDKNLRHEEVVSRARELRKARTWLFSVAPSLTAALVASMAVMLVLAFRG